jgi:hypothetical protein
VVQREDKKFGSWGRVSGGNKKTKPESQVEEVFEDRKLLRWIED